jgi:lysophospholipase L1-like esterase
MLNISRGGWLRSFSAFVAAPTVLSAQSPAPFRVLILGDSIAWGQGLAQQDRWRSILCDQLRIALNRDVECIAPYIHSGAVIGIGDRNEIGTGDNLYKGTEKSFVEARDEIGGEVASATPTILTELDRFAHGATVPKIDLIVVSAGINDVNNMRWLNPLVDEGELDRIIDLHCNQHLTALLDRIRVICMDANPNCLCVVLSYYQVVTEASRAAIDSIPGLLEALLGRDIAPKTLKQNEKLAQLIRKSQLLDSVIERSHEFATKSEAAIRLAVSNANRYPFSANFVWASPGLLPEQGIYATGDKRLWEVKSDPSADEDHRLAPTDEVWSARIPVCDLLFPEDETSRRFCHVASIAHPNKAAARLNYVPAVWNAVCDRLHLPALPASYFAAT